MAPLSELHFDIDNHMNRIIPAPPWHIVPYPVSYLLGHRRYPAPKKYGNILLNLRALLGVFVSLALIQLISHQIPWVAAHGPRIVASFGAAAVLEFCAFESPFAQPRNFLISQIIATVIGVSIGKLFHLRGDADWLHWLGGALACAITTSLMDLTKTVHPPAGATALLAVVDDTAASLGWKLIPLVLLGCSIMLTVALILNNILTRFPLYWWTPNELKPELKTRQPSNESLGGKSEETEKTDVERGTTQKPVIVVIPGEVVVPDHIQLSPEETALLEQISKRL